MRDPIGLCNTLQFDIIFLTVIIDTANGNIVDVPYVIRQASQYRIAGCRSRCGSGAKKPGWRACQRIAYVTPSPRG